MGSYASMHCNTPCNGIPSHRVALKALASFNQQATKWNILSSLILTPHFQVLLSLFLDVPANVFKTTSDYNF